MTLQPTAKIKKKWHRKRKEKKRKRDLISFEISSLDCEWFDWVSERQRVWEWERKKHWCQSQTVTTYPRRLRLWPIRIACPFKGCFFCCVQQHNCKYRTRCHHILEKEKNRVENKTTIRKSILELVWNYLYCRYGALVLRTCFFFREYEKHN